MASKSHDREIELILRVSSQMERFRRFQNYSIIVLYTHREIQVKFTIEAADNKIVSKNT